MGTLNLGSSGQVTGGDAEFTGIVTKPAHPYLLCQSNTSVTVNNNTNTLLTHFGNTRISQGGMAFNTSNGRITIPRAGLYRVRSRICDDNEARWGNNHVFSIWLNGAQYIHSQLFYMPVGNWGTVWYAPSYVDMVVNCTNDSDYMQLYFYQDSGSNTGLHDAFCSLEVYLIG